MTTAQLQILDEIHDKLAEHFESHVLCVTFDSTTDSDTKEMIGKAVYWGGGCVHGLGCASYANEVMKRKCFDGEEDEIA